MTKLQSIYRYAKNGTWKDEASTKRKEPTNAMLRMMHELAKDMPDYDFRIVKVGA